ncbi:MAG: hypothetical protein WBA44_01285, partial [Mesorhizobium sp.]
MVLQVVHGHEFPMRPRFRAFQPDDEGGDAWHCALEITIIDALPCAAGVCPLPSFTVPGSATQP